MARDAEQPGAHRRARIEALEIAKRLVGIRPRTWLFISVTGPSSHPIFLHSAFSLVSTDPHRQLRVVLHFSYQSANASTHGVGSSSISFPSHSLWPRCLLFSTHSFVQVFDPIEFGSVAAGHALPRHSFNIPAGLLADLYRYLLAPSHFSLNIALHSYTPRP